MAIESGIGEYSNGINKGWALKVNVSSVDVDFSRSPRATSAMAASLLEQAKDKAVRLLNRPWHKRQVIWNEDEWDILEHHSEAYDTQALMISCGTVTIDGPESSERKVLLIWNKNTKAVSKSSDTSILGTSGYSQSCGTAVLQVVLRTY